MIFSYSAESSWSSACGRFITQQPAAFPSAWRAIVPLSLSRPNAVSQKRWPRMSLSRGSSP